MSRFSTFRVIAGSCVPWRAQGMEARNTTEGWQDKRAHIARRSGGCSCMIFWRVPHIAGHRRNVYEAAKLLYLFFFFYIAVPRHG